MSVAGRRSAAFGYERGEMEVWAYPLQILDRLEVSFQLEDYPVELRGSELASHVNVRPEATVVTYSHSAFTARQTIFAPLDESGVVMTFDVESTLPLKLLLSFRPRLRLMWPAGSTAPGLSWDDDDGAFLINDDAGRYAGLVGSPAARRSPVLPYREEPRETSARLELDLTGGKTKGDLLTVVIAGSVRGSDEARAVYKRLHANARGLYERNVEHYRRLLSETTSVATPDERLNEAYRWAKVGIDKGFVENPTLGAGLVAGYRAAGASERPGFAWFFGRDAFWTSFAMNSYGDFKGSRAALDFLAKFQRDDGKIPHEIPQSAALVNWFDDYPYAWASADSTPLYIAAHADLLRASGNLSFTRTRWASILKAFRHAASTDTDGNGLIENSRFGHGWVEGGALYPAHEEIYLQGVWMEALRGLSEMAEALGDERVAGEAEKLFGRARESTEKTYWSPSKGFYAFATNSPRRERRRADPGPNRSRTQERMNELDRATLIDENTVMPAVPLWWGLLEDERAQLEIDRLGGGALATDWGTRLTSSESRLYDPISYHHGSVWPLFTGWASVAAYRYGRAQVGHQALMANALLTRPHAPGYVTEVLSGEFNAPFNRSSHHQIWSQAMVVAPLVRGLLGLEFEDGGSRLRFAPQLPADWNGVEIRNARASSSSYDINLRRTQGRMTIRLVRRDASGRAGPSGEGERADARAASASVPGRNARSYLVSPAFPLDAEIRRVRLNGRATRFNLLRRGDAKFAEVEFENRETRNELVFEYEEGTDVYLERAEPVPGARNTGIRIIRSRAEREGLRLLVEGCCGRSYTLRIRSPRRATEASGFRLEREGWADARITIVFDAGDSYMRREIFVPLSARRARGGEEEEGAVD